MVEVLEESYVVDSDVAHLRHHEAQLGEIMIEAVRSHNNEYDHFSPLEHTPEDYSFQRADCVAMVGEAGSTDTFHQLAPLIYPAFSHVVAAFRHQREDLLIHTADVLKSGKDVHVVTDHRDVIGVAVGSAILAAALYESGEIDHGEVDTEITVSSMLKYTAILNAPAAEFLRSVFSKTCFVVPSGNQENRHRLPHRFADDFNAASLRARHVEKHKPTIVAVAPSGTRDVRVTKAQSLLPGRPKSGYYMCPPSDGTVKEYMTSQHMLAMGLDLSKGEKGVYIDRMWLPPENPSLTKLVIMRSIADGMSKQTGIPSHAVTDWNDFQALKKLAKDLT